MTAKRLPVLDGFRAISILAVLSAHLLPLGPKSWRLNEAFGAMGMTIFFSLSGFLIASQLLKNPNVPEFLIKRFARIAPLLLLYTTTFYVLLFPDAAKWFFNSFFLSNYFNQYLDRFSGPLWSLGVEVQFYIAIALAVAIGGRKAIWLVVPSCLMITGIRVYCGATINILTHLRVDEILIGSCIALLFDKRAFNIPVWLFGLTSFTTVLCCLQQFYIPQFLRPYATGLMLLSALSISEASTTYDALSSRILRYIAKISYALYIIHGGVFGLLETDNKIVKYLVVRPIGLGVTFALAHLSTFHWEQKWIDIAKRSPVNPDRVSALSSIV